MACGAVASRTLRIAAVAAIVVGLAACTRSVAWEEEVVLNTGETVRVARSVDYELGGDAGNPFDLGWRTVRRSARLSFHWSGQRWQFDAHGGPMLLAIGPDQRPAILAMAEAGAWDSLHRYACTIPFYVQFQPGASGQQWQWPPGIDPFFYGHVTNLLQEIPRPDGNRGHYAAADIRAINQRALVTSPARQRIDPGYTGDKCRPAARGKQRMR